MSREDLRHINTGAYHAKNRLLDHWCEFGLRKSPFSIEVNFVSGVKLGHFQDVIDSLRFFVSSPESFAIVSGHTGVGKTTILDAFILETEKRTYKIKASSSLTTEELLENLLREFSLDIPEYGVSDSAKLSLFLDEIGNYAESMILIIDDAHLLNMACINIILELINKQKDAGSLKIILAGRETLFERIIKQYTHSMINVRPLHFIVSAVPEHQIKSYLHSCLVRANWPGILPEISTSCLKQIYELSAGVPCRINMAADKMLYNEIKTSIHPEPNNNVMNNSQSGLSLHNAMVNMLLLVSYLVILCGCYGWYSSVTLQQHQSFVASPASDHNQMTTSNTNQNRIDYKKTAKVSNTNKRVITNIQFADNKHIAMPANTKSGIKKPASDLNTMQNVEFLKYLEQSEGQNVTRGDVFLHKASVNSDIKTKVEARVDSNVIRTTKKSFAYDGDKIDALNGYTIQVMGSYDISAINKFKNSTKLGSKMYVYKTMLGSKEWNILVYNSFKSYPEAKHEQATLRSRYFLQNVWVKSLDVVHKEMRKI
ncbi:MAG: AAA family ATPase [Legionellales bacterium]|jgi:septal ring-binding cell division protein DamX/type II secretory pathway predicted ATPase ExeA|nr:AAA family ATPase [Legionellales bacterium]